MWALIILKFEVNFSIVQPTPTLDYMHKTIISSCFIISIILSIRKWDLCPFWSKFLWMSLSDSYRIYFYKKSVAEKNKG